MTLDQIGLFSDVAIQEQRTDLRNMAFAVRVGMAEQKSYDKVMKSLE